MSTSSPTFLLSIVTLGLGLTRNPARSISVWRGRYCKMCTFKAVLRITTLLWKALSLEAVLAFQRNGRASALSDNDCARLAWVDFANLEWYHLKNLSWISKRNYKAHLV